VNSSPIAVAIFLFPEVEVLDFTSAGISARIDISLHLVERLASRELAQETARRLEFDWHEGTSP
jgi:transcriptional regulator GlxA family with amidase domain